MKHVFHRYFERSDSMMKKKKNIISKLLRIGFHFLKKEKEQEKEKEKRITNLCCLLLE